MVVLKWIFFIFAQCLRVFTGQITVDNYIFVKSSKEIFFGAEGKVDAN